MPTEQDIINSINGSTNIGGMGQPRRDEPEPDESPSRAREALAFVWETIKIILISLAIILPIRYYLVQPFFVKGASMEENFHDGDYLLIDEISYRFNEPERGDVIVFRYPENPSQFFIKRIVGLPNERVEIKNNRVVIYNDANPDGLELEEYYLSAYQQTNGNSSVKLEAGQYYVLGDNRLQSSDSRRWGTLDKDLITGKAWVRLWPFDKVSKVEAVTY